MLDKTVSRRTIAKGAAWSIPVVAISSTAPVMASSGDATCPVVDPSMVAFTSNHLFSPSSEGHNGWMADGGYGTGNITSHPAPDPANNNVLDPREYQFQRDGQAESNANGVVSLSFTIPVTAGETYTFVTPLRTGQGNTVQTWKSIVNMHIDGVLQWSGDTKELFKAPDYPKGPTGTQTFAHYTPTGTYQATKDGTVTIRYNLFTVGRVGAPQFTGDDIWLTLPTVTCS